MLMRAGGDGQPPGRWRIPSTLSLHLFFLGEEPTGSQPIRLIWAFQACRSPHGHVGPILTYERGLQRNAKSRLSENKLLAGLRRLPFLS